MDEGFRFGNKQSKKHIEYKRHKMNVSIAAQTLSSIVADALEFLMQVKHPEFIEAAGNIQFIRYIDQLFDLLNSRNLNAKGFKKPLKSIDRAIWMNTIYRRMHNLSKQIENSGSYSYLKTSKKNICFRFDHDSCWC